MSHHPCQQAHPAWQPHQHQHLNGCNSTDITALQAKTTSKKALQDLTVMLLTIAERYAEGKVSELLDEDQIGDVEPAAHREHLRVVAVGGVVVVTMTGAALAGLPEAALSALLPIVVIVAIILLYREKGPTPSQLRDLVIPR
jgi:hypothetical protein